MRELMQIEILQEQLIKGITIALRGVGSRPQLPILANLLLEAKAGVLTISSTDLELGIAVTMAAKVGEVGKITVPARLFSDFIGSLPGGKVELRLEKESLKAIAGSYKASFQTVAADEFPQLAKSREGEGVKLSFEGYTQAAQRVMFAAAKDALRPVLTGVLHEFTKTKIKMVATDGFRLSMQEVAYEGEVGVEKLLLPARVVAEVARLEKSEKFTMAYLKETNQVVFRVGLVVVVSQILEGNFPDYGKILPKSFQAEIEASREDLLQAVRSVQIFARDNSNVMKWTASEGELVVWAETPERGEAKVVVPIKLTGEGGGVTFNAKFVLDFLQISQAEMIWFGMGAALSPGAFREPNNEQFLYVVMPINV
jgi:DNA polymerase III subunit beta